MENINLWLMGLSQVFTLQNLLACLIGTIAGVYIGAIPGIGVLTAISVLLPLTFAFDPTTAIIMLAAIYYGTMYGGAITAVLINIPGDTPNICTAMEGYELTKKGLPGKALSTCFMSSFIGGSIGMIILVLSGPMLARLGLRFGPPELALLIFLAMTSIGWLLGDNIVTGLLATGLGVLFATVGTDQAAGLMRFYFGTPNLMAGVTFVPLVIGVFGFSQVIELLCSKEGNKAIVQKVSIKDMVLSFKEIKQVLPVQIRHGFLGSFIGVLPGAGATTAAFISYIFERRLNKQGSKFGTGMMEGCAAPEASNNACAAMSFAPMLTLGIPGSGATALLLGGLLMWGLQPGPLLFTQRPDFVWPLMASFYLGNLVALLICLISIPLIIRACAVPRIILGVVIFTICVVAAYATSNSMFDVFFMLVVGFFTYFLKAAKIASAPILLAFVLTPMLERFTRQSFDMTRGDPSVFTQSAISWVLIVLIFVFCLSPTIAKRIKAARSSGKQT